MSAKSRMKISMNSTPCALKAAAFTLPVLKIYEPDTDAVATLLAERVNKAPDFFRNAPIVIDLQASASSDGLVDIPLLIGLLRGYELIPVGLKGGDAAQNQVAEAMELAILQDAKGHPRNKAAPAASGANRIVTTCNTRVLDRPVRSGQRFYARDGDLVVMSSVSSGAEVMADGHIHIYGALRGRALAGVKGKREARVFCQQMDAELVAVAGHYRISENIAAQYKDKAVQVFLDQEDLCIEPL